jgi:16S rRNA (uracil1498-N3)-methyltransferase
MKTAAPRLFVPDALAAGAGVDLDEARANYLVNVLRLRGGAPVLVFNGRDGEWTAALAAAGRRRWRLAVDERTRAQPTPPDLHYLFAPLKHARLDYMVQKAVEMGVGRLRPVLTRHGQVSRLNRHRLETNAIEAAEQCGILSLPVIDEPETLAETITRWTERDAPRRIVFCDEGAAGADPLALLAELRGAPLAVLIGPEGGFADDERRMLRDHAEVTAIPLGPRILRADTAAVAALALVQAVLGDWRHRAPGG